MSFNTYNRKRTYVLSQKCEFCGVTVTDIEAMPTCVICGKRLCANCGQHEFCDEHWNEISDDQKEHIQKIDGKKDKEKSFFYIRIAAIFGLFIAAIFLADYTIAIFAFMGYFVALTSFLGAIVLAYFYGNSKRQIRIHKRQVAFGNTQPRMEKKEENTRTHVEIIPDPKESN